MSTEFRVEQDDRDNQPPTSLRGFVSFVVVCGGLCNRMIGSVAIALATDFLGRVEHDQGPFSCRLPARRLASSARIFRADMLRNSHGSLAFAGSDARTCCNRA